MGNGCNKHSVEAVYSHTGKPLSYCVVCNQTKSQAEIEALREEVQRLREGIKSAIDTICVKCTYDGAICINCTETQEYESLLKENQ